jgi:hypothetical protein
MNETVITLVLLAICAGAVWLVYWVLTHGGNHAVSGAGNPGGDPNALSADPGQVINGRAARQRPIAALRTPGLI